MRGWIVAHHTQVDAAEAAAASARAAKASEAESTLRAYEICAVSCACSLGVLCVAKVYKRCSVCSDVKKSACGKMSCKEKKKAELAAVASAPQALPWALPR